MTRAEEVSQRRGKTRNRSFPVIWFPSPAFSKTRFPVRPLFVRQPGQLEQVGGPRVPPAPVHPPDQAQTLGVHVQPAVIHEVVAHLQAEDLSDDEAIVSDL